MESVEKILTNVFDKSLRKLTERQREVVFFYVKDWANLTSKQRKTKALEADKIRSTKERIQVERRARHTRPLTEIEQAEYDAAWNSEAGADLSAAVEPASDRLATPAPVATAKRRKKKPSIENVALDYMRTEFKQGQFQSALKFHKHLIKTAGLDESPFEIGTGTNAGKLFCPAASSFFDDGTLSKMWPEIRAE